MRWRKGRRSQNIEDRRGMRMGTGVKIGGGMTIIALLAGLLLGQDPRALLQMIGGGQTRQTQAPTQSKEQQQVVDFIKTIKGYNEDSWSQIFRSRGGRFQPSKLVLYDNVVQSACGTNSAAAGPFYCPGDHKVYISLSFMNELKRLGAHGDFAFAYVISHEVGHHVQNLLGTSKSVMRAQQRSRNKADANALSVMMELQADCYAGVWAHHTHQRFDVLEQGDIEEGLNAAASVGDDRLMKVAGRRAHPESFTHGSAKQRVQWFRHGLSSGNIDECNTFARAEQLGLR